MNFSQAINTCLIKKYATFSGRARRKEYWYWSLFNTLISFLIFRIPIVALFLGLFLFLPSLAVAVRRLHDTGRSGWNLLWGFLPIIGGIILLVYDCTDSQKGDNRYGPNPKELSDS